MEQLGGFDASFLYFETPTMHMHVLGLIIIDPSTIEGGYSFGLVRKYVEARAPLIPGMRRKLANVPLNLGHPYWVEDKSFDLDFHLHRVQVAAPGGDRELGDLVGDIGSRPLDRGHPLWEMHVVEGLADGTIALVAKMHHSTVDGITGANMMAQLFDLTPGAPIEREGMDPWVPERDPSEISMLARGIADLAARPVRIAQILPGTVGRVVKLVTQRRARGTGMPVPFTAPRTSFNATVTAHRSVAFTSIPMADIKAIKNHYDVKVNDVVMAVCSGALRRYLDKRGELPEKSLVSAIPISVHAENPGPGINKVSVMFTSLASDIVDPGERMRVIAESNEGAKEDHKMLGATTLQDWAEHAAPNTFSLAARLYSSLRFANRHPVVHNLVISNVPGPPIDLYCAGGRITRLFPLGPVLDGAGLNVTVLSQQDEMGFGLIACRELMPDLWDLCSAIEEEVGEILALTKA